MRKKFLMSAGLFVGLAVLLCWQPLRSSYLQTVRPVPAQAGQHPALTGVETPLQQLTVGAKVIQVTNGNDSGAGSLRQAISLAVVGDTISFQAGVTVVTLTTAELVINKNLTINGGSGVTIQRSAAGGTPNFRIFNVTSGTVNLSNLTISNGLLGAGQNGGGIANGGTLTLTGCTVSGNSASASTGGGISSSGSLTLSACVVSSNSAGTSGAIDHVGPLTMTNCTVSGNTAQFDGGVATANGTAQLTGCTFSGNTVTNSESTSFKNFGGAATLTNCTIVGTGGNGVINLAAAGQTATTTLVNCTLSNAKINNTDDGGAVSAQVNLKNTILTGVTPTIQKTGTNTPVVSQGNNLASDTGGGFLTGSGDLTNMNPLLAVLGNYGGTTQTLALLPGSPAINAGTATGVPTTDQRGISRVGNVDIGAFESRGFSIAATSGGNQVTAPNTAFANPLVATVTSANSEPVSGGLVTFTPPVSGASCTVAGNPATISSGAATTGTVTANGTLGTYNVTAGANGVTGSVSYSLSNCPSSVVTNGNDSGAGSLRDVIDNACAGSTISFQAGITTVTLTTAELAITKDLTINGGSNGVTVQRSTAGGTPDFRIFNITGGGTVALANLTITNGRNTGFGCGIRANGPTLVTLTDCTLTGNAGPGGSGSGGGLSVAFTALNANRLTVSNNQANQGGGVYLQDSVATIQNSTIVNNSGLNGDGIRFTNTSSSPTLTLVNSTISGNNVVANSAGLRVQTASGTTLTANLTNVTVTANTTTNTGQPGAISLAGSGTSILNLNNCIVSGNLSGGAPSDITGTASASSSNNLIGVGGGLTNGVNGNIVGVNNPLVAALGNYGGTTQTHALLPGSPAINAGTASGAPSTDQRGIARVGNVDIGAFESRGFTIAATSGGSQSTLVNTAFGNPLVATVTSANNEPVNGGLVTFTAPGSGAGCTVAGNPASISGTGTATTGTLTANGTAGTYNVTAAANGTTGSATFSLTNNSCPTITVTNPAVSSGTLGVVFSQTFTQTGGNGQVTFSTTSSLPVGLILSSGGVLSGTPQQTGTFPIVVQATDSNNCFGTGATYNLVISCPTITLTPTNVPAGVVGTAYNQVITASPAAGYTFSVSSGSLPSGITLSAGGTLSGTPTQAGTFSFSVQALNGSTGCTGTQAYVLVVTAVAPTHSVTQFYPISSTSGKPLTITGTGFVIGSTQVFFGETRLIPAVINSMTATSINVTVPASSTGAGNINGYLTVRVNGVDVTTLSLAQNAANPADPAATFPEFVLWGDANRDGIFATNDSALARAFLQFQATPTARQLLAVDVVPLNGNGSRGNGQLTTTDFSFLRAVLAGQTSF